MIYKNQASIGDERHLLYSSYEKSNIALTIIIACIICLDLYTSTAQFIPSQARRFYYALVLLLIICSCLSKRVLRLEKSKIIWCMLYIYIAISFTFEGDMLEWDNLRWLTIILCFLIITIDYDSSRMARYLIIAFSLFQTIGIVLELINNSTWYSIYSVLTNKIYSESATHILSAGKFYIDNGYLAGFSYNPGFTACYIINGLMMLTMSRAELRPWTYKLMRTILFIALLLTGKRGQPIFYIISEIIVYVMLSKNKRQSSIRIAKIVSVGLLAYISGFFLYISNVIPRLNRILFFIYGDRGNIDSLSSGRGEMWIEALERFMEHPILGAGFLQYFKEYGYETHNTYIQVLYELGIIGFILFLSALLFNLMIWVKRYRRSRKNRQLNNDKLTCCYHVVLSFQIYFIGICFVENCLNQIEFYYMYLFVCLLAEGSVRYFCKNMEIHRI